MDNLDMLQTMFMLEMLTKDSPDKFSKVTNPILERNFTQWKSDSIDIIKKEHSNHQCILPTIIPTLEKANIVFSYRVPMVRAWVMPGESEDIWVNSEAFPRWNKQSALRAILHEAIHITKDANGHYQLGPDSQYREKPLGKLFGKNIHWSPDIDRAILSHMRQHTTDPKLWEKDVFDRTDPKDIPFLIPEFRF